MGAGCGPLPDGSYRGSGVMLVNADGGDKRMILIGVQRRFSPQVRRNHVIAQFPKAGAHEHRSTKAGPPVRLVLSRGRRPRR
jgi:hypothetical protein